MTIHELKRMRIFKGHLAECSCGWGFWRYTKKLVDSAVETHKKRIKNEDFEKENDNYANTTRGVGN